MNYKSLFERMNNIKNRGPDKWLSRSLNENASDAAKEDTINIINQMGTGHSSERKDGRVGGTRGKFEKQIDTAFGIKQDDGKNKVKRKDPSGEELESRLKNAVPAGVNVNYDSKRDLTNQVREQEISQTSLTSNGDNDTISLHNSGSGMNAARLNENVEKRNNLRKQLEEDLKKVDDDDNAINEEPQRLKDGITQMLMEIGDGSSKDKIREKMIAIAARAQVSPRKVRAGKGARSILSDDRNALIEPGNKKRLTEAFGDGSWEQVTKFGDGMKILKDSLQDNEWDDVARKWYSSQGTNIKNVFSGAGDLGSKNNGARNHFAGFDENGNKIAGTKSNMARTLGLVKVFLQQAGLDGYTGTPLSFEHMEPDHIRGYQTKIDGVTPSADDRFRTDHPDNWIWTHTGINNIKSDQTMPDFLNGLENMPDAKVRGLMSDEQLKLQDEGVRYLEDDTTDFARSFLTSHSDDQGSVNVLKDSLTPEMIQEREQQQMGLIQELQSKGLGIDESRLLKDVFAAGGSIPAEQRLNLPSQNKEKVRERSQARIGDNAIKEMFSVMAGKRPEDQAKISRAWKSSWDESLETITRNFDIYDRARQNQDEQVTYDNNDLVLKDSEDEDFLNRKVIRGGPSLRKLFALAMRTKLGDSGERIANQITVREWLSNSIDLNLFL